MSQEPDRNVGWLGSHVGPALALGGALGYLLGSLMLAQFARSLGVAVADLGLTVQDRLLVAAMSVLTGTLPIVAVGVVVFLGVADIDGDSIDEYGFVESWREDLTRSVLAFAALSGGVLGYAALMGGYVPVFSFRENPVAISAYAVGGVLVFYVIRRGIPFEQLVASVVGVRAGAVRFTSIAVVAAAAVVVLGLAGARNWANELQEGDLARGPVQLSLVLQPSTGQVEAIDQDGATICVTRVTDGVYLSDGQTFVVDGLSFSADGCSPSGGKD